MIKYIENKNFNLNHLINVAKNCNFLVLYLYVSNKIKNKYFFNYFNI